MATVMQRRHHCFGDLGGEFLFLLLGFSRPELYDHMGHACLLYWAGRAKASAVRIAAKGRTNDLAPTI
jgi:hypothetical protein